MNVYDHTRLLKVIPKIIPNVNLDHNIMNMYIILELIYIFF